MQLYLPLLLYMVCQIRPPLISAGLHVLGLTAGPMTSLISPLCANTSKMHDIGVRTGLQWAILAIPTVVSGPIGGALLAIDYSHMQIFCGVTMLGGTIFYGVARVANSGPKLWVAC